jgi:hypothetical protein
MGFTLQEAQWLVKFYRHLPGGGAATADAQYGDADAQYHEDAPAEAQRGYSDHQAAGYYDDYR